MADFLLELLSEEIPARMQAKARNDLARLFAECTSGAGLATGAVDVHSTPRRLVLIARDVAEATEASREEMKGPRANAPAAGARGVPAQDRPDARPARGARRRAFRGDRTGRARRGRRARGDGQADRRRLPLAQVDALGRRRPQMGAAAPRDRRDARRGDRAGRVGRNCVGRGDGRPPLPPSRRHHGRRRRRLRREIARLPRDRRPGRARETDPRGRRESRGGRGADLAGRTRGWWSRMRG